jgi:dipeptidyl aminopeptidase/acylaminoacyl peptidase
MRKQRFWTLLLAASLLMLLAGVAHAQDVSGASATYAAVVDGKLTLFGVAAAPVMVQTPANYRDFFSLAWSPDGSKLAFLQQNDQFQNKLLVTDLTGKVTELDAALLESGFPITFSPEGDILYIGQGDNSAITQNQQYTVTVNRIRPEAGVAPEKIGEFASGVGCGGGSPIPADWQYWGETGFGGNALTLVWTPYGLLHSNACSGGSLALLNLQTGEDKPVGPQQTLNQGVTDALGRVALAPDGKRFAAVKTQYAEPVPIRSLVLGDLETLTLIDMATTGAPDQLAWNVDDTLFYSTRDQRDNLVSTLSAEQKQQLNTVLGYEMTDLPSYEVNVRQLNVKTGEDQLIYTADAYAIGRMFQPPGGKSLLFSQIPNLSAWVEAVASGKIDMTSAQSDAQQRATVPVSLLELPLGTGQNAAVVQPNAQQATFRPVTP